MFFNEIFFSYYKIINHLMHNQTNKRLDFSNKIVLVTGGTGALGRAITRSFILRGLLIHDYVALGLAGFIGFASNSWLIASLFTYTAENFPTSIRSIASGAVEGLGSALAAIGPIIFVLLHPYGFLSIMTDLASFLSVAAAVIILLGNRSVGISLEQLNK
jgi:hypothetical protein